MHISLSILEFILSLRKSMEVLYVSNIILPFQAYQICLHQHDVFDKMRHFAFSSRSIRRGSSKWIAGEKEKTDVTMCCSAVYLIVKFWIESSPCKCDCCYSIVIVTVATVAGCCSIHWELEPWFRVHFSQQSFCSLIFFQIFTQPFLIVVYTSNLYIMLI